MAHRHGLAGKYPKAESVRRQRKLLFAAIGGGGLTLAVLGFVTGYFWTWGWWGPGLSIVAMFAVYGFYLAVRRRMTPYFEQLAKERIWYLRGGQGEAVVAWILEDLDNGWHVFNGLKLERDSDIDHVLVGPGGLYCISTKSQRGLFIGTPDGLLHNGEPSRFGNDAMRQALDLKDRLGVAMGRDVPWVQPVLAVPYGFTGPDACGGKVWLVHMDDLLKRLVPDDGPKRLTLDQIGRVVKVLDMIESSAVQVYQRRDRKSGTQIVKY